MSTGNRPRCYLEMAGKDGLDLIQKQMTHRNKPGVRDFQHFPSLFSSR